MTLSPGLAERRVQAEQLRLLLSNHASSTTPAFLIGLLVVWAVGNEANTPGLQIWFACQMAIKLYCAADARRILAAEIDPERAAGLVRRQMLLNAINAVAWSSLVWVTLGTTSMAGSLMVIAIMTGVSSSGLTQLSPVLSVYALFLTITLGSLALKLALAGEATYEAMAAACVVYYFLMLGQARNYAKAARASIELRFENIGLVEQLRAETELASAARREAEQANLAKSKFLAAASHDLRQPIHAQGLFLEVLAGTPLTAHQAEVLASARSASRASGEMLNTLLDFSRIDAGVVKPSAKPFALQGLLHKIENDLAPLADAKSLAYRSPDTGAVVHSDPALVEMILRNLVSNAIRYTERGGVLIACRRRGASLAVEVRDTGIGIAPEHQEEVFREFHQLGNPERDHRKGLGLGLAIAQGLANALGHALTLSSRPGQGSVFRLTLPLTRAAVAPDVVSLAGTVDLRGARMLVIDDDEAVRAGMAHLLRGWGCLCDTASSLGEARALAREHAPSVLISDYRLREQHTGAEAIAALRAELGSEIPALMVTGDTTPERLREAMASSIPLLHKPVAPDQLRSALTALLTPAAVALPG
jgi:signal transduction histidine kinase/CheY-like chemotaxis protein